MPSVIPSVASKSLISGIDAALTKTAESTVPAFSLAAASCGSRLSISISREHQENSNDIKGIFEDFDVEVNANHIRCTAGTLPLQVTVFIGSAIAGGLLWDLLKLAIKKVYKKFPNSRITLRDKDSIMYSIKNDFTVLVIVVPDRKKEFEHIKNFDDLGKYINLKRTKK